VPVQALTAIASSPLRIDLRMILPDCLPVLSSFLRLVAPYILNWPWNLLLPVFSKKVKFFSSGLSMAIIFATFFYRSCSVKPAIFKLE
jgi:hypothetical protein